MDVVVVLDAPLRRSGLERENSSRGMLSINSLIGNDHSVCLQLSLAWYEDLCGGLWKVDVCGGWTESFGVSCAFKGYTGG